MNRFFTLLFAASCLTAVGQYEVGDVGPGGGYIFYFDTLGNHDWDYLEVSDASFICYQWGGRRPSDEVSVSEDSRQIGRGAYYTSATMDYWFAHGGNTSSVIPAATIKSLRFGRGGKRDWFLPSSQELMAVHTAFGEDLESMISWSTGHRECYTSSFPSEGVPHANYRINVVSGQEYVSQNYYTSGTGGGDSQGRPVLPIRVIYLPNESSCGTGTAWDPTSQTCIVDESACGWQPDGNGDNLIGVNDLLDLLGVYGDTDDDQDGIWDSADDCVGEYDECGVCNGSGPSIPIIESIEILYDSLYAEQIDEWWVFEVGADTTYEYVCGLGCTDPLAENYDESVDTDDGSCVYPWACGDPLEYQGYDYETVQIGEQCWFAENLRAENYRNGGEIVSGQEEIGWSTFEVGQRTIYGEGTSDCDNYIEELDACDESLAIDVFGLLYNAHAVLNAQELCPTDWHVPSETEWDLLKEQSISVTDDFQSLLSIEYWSNGTGNNSSGFNALPGGNRYSSGWFSNAGSYGCWWTSTVTGLNEAKYVLINGSQSMVTLDSNFSYGFSVRCIKDAE